MKDETDPSPEIKIDEETCLIDERIEEEPDISNYLHESGQLYTEDVDQYMAVLPDIETPTAEVTIEDIQAIRT